MQPRDAQVAARTVSVLLAVAVLLTVLTAPLTPPSRVASPATVIWVALAIVVVCLLSWAAHHFDEGTRWSWALCPLAAIALLVIIDVLTRDASVTAQIYFLFPVIYGGALLPRRGAIVILVASLAGDLAVLLALTSWRTVLLDFLNVGAVLTTVVVVLVRSAERQAELMHELRQLAAIDPLTGLVTRRVLDEAATAAITGGGCDGGTSLLLLDVDQFKTVNDTYGHPVGDTVLVQLAQVVREGCRPSDVVCRMGGDELAVLLPGCPAEDAERRARSLIGRIRAAPFAVSEVGPIDVSVSIGLAHAPTNATDLRTLYAAADGALYEAKRAGRDRVVSQADRRPDGRLTAAAQMRMDPHPRSAP